MTRVLPRLSPVALILWVTLYASATAQAPAAADLSGPRDFLRANMDFSVDPGVDFFAYANGAWLARNPIPATESWWGIGALVNEQLYSSLRTINEKAASEPHPAGSELQKIADFWVTAMDVDHAEALGVHPLDAELARIDQVQNVHEAIDAAFALAPLDIGVFFDVSVSQDERNSSAMAVHLSQGGLGLPDRDFYFNPERGVARSRQEYLEHIARTLQSLGRSPADARSQAAAILKFETSLAKSSRKLEELNDPDKNYHPFTPAFLTRKYTPSIDWSAKLAAWNIHPDTLIVGQPEFFDSP